MAPSLLAFIGGCVCLFFGCAISAAAGVGGGGINVPIFLLVFGYSFEHARTLSLVVVLGNAMMQVAINFKTRHPTLYHRPIIFWELVLILLPAQLGGNHIGGILNTMLPTSIVYIVAFLVLLFAAVYSSKKARMRYLDESQAISKVEEARRERHHSVSSRGEGGGGGGRRGRGSSSTSIDRSGSVSNPIGYTPPALLLAGETKVAGDEETANVQQYQYSNKYSERALSITPDDRDDEEEPQHKSGGQAAAGGGRRGGGWGSNQQSDDLLQVK